jgi:hypothetical protein
VNDLTVQEWIAAVLALTVPGSVVVALGMVRGYSIKIWRHDGRRVKVARREEEDE